MVDSIVCILSLYTSNLFSAICAEITQTVIQNAQQAIEWLKSTFFYVR